MQAKISCFFKPTAITRGDKKEEDVDDDEGELSVLTPIDVSVTYSRRTPQSRGQISRDSDASAVDGEAGIIGTTSGSARGAGCCVELLNKKRSYAQYHLELGQSDFLLHTCPECGMTYTCGDESDEKLHKAHHRNYNDGLQFKGWQNERQIAMPWSEGQRVLLVLDGDPPSHKRKVEQVLQLMERDLGLSMEWLFHRQCKVFLYISRSRIVACLIVEPIKTAYRVIPRAGYPESSSSSLNIEATILKPAMPTSSMLHFGNATFHRERTKKCSLKGADKSSWDDGALLCTEESVEAVCGVRAIWVAPSQRRHKIATRLMDIARTNFELGTTIEISQFAYSHPTSSGRAFAARYSGTPSFLVYKS